jgi:opacity protein-like surface antigen
MKKLIIIVCAIMFSWQMQAQPWAAGLGFVYGSEIEQLGIAAKGQYNGITENIDGSLGLHFFFPDKYKGFGGELKTSLFTVNLDGHYNFDVSESVDVFGLGGLNIASFKVKCDGCGPLSSEASDTEIGLNLGGGVSGDIADNLKGFGEIKYTLSEFDQLVVALGVMMTFGGTE